MAVFTKLSKEDIENLISDYTIGNLNNFEEIVDGIENSNFKIFCNNQPYILTIFEKRVGAKLLHSIALHITPVNSKATSTSKLSSTSLTFYCTSMLTNWLPPLINALKLSLVPFSPELSSAHLTSH